MTTLEQLIRECKDFYDGRPWYGSNFKEIVDDITPEEALAVPGNGHSIARLLYHMIKWRKALTIRLEGNLDYRANDDDPDNWIPLSGLDADSWEKAKSEFAQLQSTLIRELEARNDAFLDTEFLPGKLYRFLVIGIVQHDIYHLGQISLLKQLLRSANPKN